MPPSVGHRAVAAIRACLRFARICVFLAADSLCALVPYRRQDTAVIVRLDAIGDFFVWLQSGAVDVAQFARRSAREVVLLANPVWADYAEKTGLWDRVVRIDPAMFARRPAYRIRTLVRIRSIGPRLLVQPRAARLFLVEDAIARMSGAQQRIGSLGVLFNTSARLRNFGNRYYDRVIVVSEQLGVHETVRNDQFVRALTGESSRPFQFPTSRQVATGDQIVIAVGAGWSGRVWPIEKLSLLIGHLLATRPDSKIMLLGGKTDENSAVWLGQQHPGKLTNAVGRTTLDESVQAIASARLVICNESSAYHIAMAVGTRVLCLLGGGHYGWFAPYPPTQSTGKSNIALSMRLECFGCNWHCRYPIAQSGAVMCVDSIPVEAAIDSAERLLENGI